MERFLLFIRDTAAADDVADIHPDESSARKALAAYVRRRTREQGRPMPINDDVAIASYFEADGALYAIARISPAR
ncbi:hypothetical protein [Sphingomonas lacusdianchii]|uniref:hypothetical protein n=1 Tax=Sphingomonas lacusdianchii TaxID=2917992 RepID=UPI001F577448|nr:hypothetical protein [Sphingomonas sp. JXJ CY 53]